VLENVAHTSFPNWSTTLRQPCTAIVAPVSGSHDVCYDNVATTPMWQRTARCDPAPATALMAPEPRFANPRSQSDRAADRRTQGVSAVRYEVAMKRRLSYGAIVGDSPIVSSIFDKNLGW
jgi:hypothetical protein